MVLVAAHSSLVVMGTVGGTENTLPAPPPLELPPLEVDEVDFFLESTLLFPDLLILESHHSHLVVEIRFRESSIHNIEPRLL